MKKLTFQVMSRTVPGSLWDVPGTSRASKNIKGMTKHPLGDVQKDVQKLTENLIIGRVLGPNLFKFPMLAHVLPGGGPLGETLMTRRAYFMMLDKSNTGSGRD